MAESRTRGKRQAPHSGRAAGQPDAGTTQPDTRRRGGQELPDEVQDRPEQNAGYDAAVERGRANIPDEPLGLGDPDAGPEERIMREESAEDELGEGAAPDSIDDRAERDVIAEVRRREGRAR